MVCVHAKGDIDVFRYVETYLRFEEESFCIAFLVEIDGRAYVGYDERLDLVCPYASEAGADENRDDTFISVVDSTVLLLTVDGRMEESAGMTLDELCATMKWLGCQDVINMDGGGSTTFYLHSNQSDTAIVNYPTDNGKFDHQGERRVANAILLLRK